MESETQDVTNREATPATETERHTTTVGTAPPSFGWNSYAERINGRFAMIGFVGLLILEYVTRKDFFTWLGF